MKKILGSVMVAGLLFAGVACGGDDESADNTETTESASGGDSGGSGNSDVEEFCAEAEKLGEELAAVLEDPMSGDAAALTQQATDLAAAAAELSSANADDVDRINECAEKITAALGG